MTTDIKAVEADDMNIPSLQVMKDIPHVPLA